MRAGSFAQALPLLKDAAGLLLDLDFRRTDPSLLVDESGAAAPRSAAEIQGILILRALRSRGVKLPALLFADLDDAARIERLQRELAPLSVIPSGEGLPELARRLRAIAK